MRRSEADALSHDLRGLYERRAVFRRDRLDVTFTLPVHAPEFMQPEIKRRAAADGYPPQADIAAFESAFRHCRHHGRVQNSPPAAMEYAMPKARENPLMRPVRPSTELAAITGDAPLSRTEVVRKVWNHIKKNKLQNPQNKREIVADDKLRPVFGKDRVTMFEMNKHLSRHVTQFE